MEKENSMRKDVEESIFLLHKELSKRIKGSVSIEPEQYVVIRIDHNGANLHFIYWIDYFDLIATPTAIMVDSICEAYKVKCLKLFFKEV